jgi:hypothetical protein
LKETYRKHPLLHTFSRFLSLLDDDDKEDNEGEEDGDKKTEGNNKRRWRDLIYILLLKVTLC